MDDLQWAMRTRFAGSLLESAVSRATFNALHRRGKSGLERRLRQLPPVRRGVMENQYRQEISCKGIRP